MEEAPRPLVRLEGVVRSFGGPAAVDGVNLDIFPGEFFSLVGASGCGKTTLLRLLAGLEQPDAGQVFIDGADMTGVPPYARPVNMMFQSYALFPHMTVEQNIAFGLKQEHLPKAAIATRVEEMLDLVGLKGFEKRKPHQLSGGQKQRVALARSLAKHPRLLLLDEPLAALDRKLREHTRQELVAIQERVGITFVMVTHDQEEAMAVSSRIALMDAGRIVQLGTPDSLYETPANRFVAGFLGEANLFEGRTVEVRSGLVFVHCPGLGHANLAVADRRQPQADTPVAVMVRPERIALDGKAPDGHDNRLAATVEDCAFLGDAFLYRLVLPGGATIRVKTGNRGAGPRPERGEEVTLSWSAADAVLLFE